MSQPDPSLAAPWHACYRFALSAGGISAFRGNTGCQPSPVHANRSPKLPPTRLIPSESMFLVGACSSSVVIHRAEFFYGLFEDEMDVGTADDLDM